MGACHVHSIHLDTRENPLQWHRETGCEEILNDIVSALKEYLKNGKYADILKAKSGVGVGFVDGKIEILHVKIKEKIQGLMEQKISEWQEDDIYAISLYVFNEEDDPCRPVAVFGYNTERQVQKSITEAADEQEARWNYAFWLQNHESISSQPVSLCHCNGFSLVSRSVTSLHSQSSSSTSNLDVPINSIDQS